MSELQARIDELAALMDEFQLAEGERTGEGWRVAFKRRTNGGNGSVAVVESFEGHPTLLEDLETASSEESVQENKPAGIPVNSPMTGIYYTAPSPSAPPFVKVGDVVEAGQVVGLIEAMKVFNEIVAPMSGTVAEIAAQSGQLVQPGEPLLYIA